MKIKKISIYELGFKATRAVYFAGGPEGGSSERQPEKSGNASKEIFAEVARMKRAIENKEISDRLIYSDDKDTKGLINNHTLFLRDDTSILISQKGEGSKHNKEGWKGMVWEDDKFEVLDRKITKIDGKDYVLVQVTHNVNKFIDPENPNYRVYTGYVEAGDFVTPLGKASMQGRKMAKTPEGRMVNGPKKGREKVPKQTAKAEFKKLWEKASEANKGEEFLVDFQINGKNLKVTLKNDELTNLVIVENGSKKESTFIGITDFNDAYEFLTNFASKS